MQQQPMGVPQAVPGQMVMVVQQGPPPGKWTSGMFDCFSDLESCFITWLCLPAAHGIVTDKLEGGGCFGPCALYCLAQTFYLHCCLCGPKRRGALRSKYGLKEEPCGDCLMECFCAPCTVCQDWRELKNRGVA